MFLANHRQVQIKEQQRFNDCSILQEIAWSRDSPMLSQKSFFLGKFSLKRINVISTKSDVLEDGWKDGKNFSEFLD